MLKAALQPIIARGYSEGQLQFGDLGLDSSIYATRIISIIQKHLGQSPSPSDAYGFADKLHGRDLYLATACAQHSPGSETLKHEFTSDHAALAWRALDNAYKTFVRDLVRFFHHTSFAGKDLADNILADLYLPDRSGASRISSYDGRSSLSTWLRVVVCHRVINLQRSSPHSKVTNLEVEVPDEPAMQTIEFAFRAQRYQEALQDSLQSACRTLTPQERLIVLWRFQDGLQLGQIGKLLGIHQSNVTRQLVRLQGRLRDQAIAILSSKYGLSAPAIQECLEDVIENPQHDISILDFVRNSATRPSAGDSQAALQPSPGKPGRQRVSTKNLAADIKSTT